MLRSAAFASRVVASMPTVLYQARVGEALQHPGEDGFVGLDRSGDVCGKSSNDPGRPSFA